jgi:hypothetical protein
MLKALPGFALIELPTKYESGLTTEKEKYASRSEGILRDASFIGELDSIYAQYQTSKDFTVYFAPYEDGESVKDGEKEYVFVPVKSLRGVKYAEA